MTIGQAATELSARFAEPVDESQVIQFGLDQYLTMSVIFEAGQLAEIGERVIEDDEESPTGKAASLKFNNELVHLRGLFDIKISVVWNDHEYKVRWANRDRDAPGVERLPILLVDYDDGGDAYYYRPLNHSDANEVTPIALPASSNVSQRLLLRMSLSESARIVVKDDELRKCESWLATLLEVQAEFGKGDGFYPPDIPRPAADLGQPQSKANQVGANNLSIKEILRQRAQAAASERHKNDPKQAEKEKVKACYHEWRDQPWKYKSAAAFAADMLPRFPLLESSKVIERWVKEWGGKPEKIARNP
jgi:hypothetical protein